MNKQAHIIFIVLDIIVLWGLWIGYSEFQRIPSEIADQANMIRFSNRLGFTLVGIGIPLMHLTGFISNFWKTFPKKCITAVNTGVYVMIAVLIVAGFTCSSWLTSQVENAGYVYCRRLSGAGAISKVLVYTKDMKICDDLVEKKKRRPRTKYKE